MKKLFGTDGIRGEAGKFPLDRRTVQAIGESLSRQFKEKLGREPRFVTGRDTRESSAWIESAFHSGAKYAHAESAGVITTPGVAFVTRSFEFDAGIVISASHNPFDDNGIKIFSPSGRKIDESTERAIEADIYAQKPQSTENEEGSVDDARAEEFKSAYLDYLAAEFFGLNLGGVKIAVDCAHGAASDLAPRLFERFGAEVSVFNNHPDGRNINDNCGSLYLNFLQEKVLETGADFGVAFDGDADRALFVDETGNIIDGDGTLWIMAQYLMAHGKLQNRTVVATVMSNIGLELALAARGIKLERAAVGDKYVLEELLKTGSQIGGEQSGHVIFPERSLVGDGMMTALYILHAMRERNLPFSEMTRGFTRYPQILVNVKVREKQPFEELPNVAAAARQIETELHGKGRLLLRYSGTENLARVMIEGEDHASIEAQARHLASVIESEIGAAPANGAMGGTQN